MVLTLYSIVLLLADGNVEGSGAFLFASRFLQLFQCGYAVDRGPLTLRNVHKLVEQNCIFTIQPDVLFYAHIVQLSLEHEHNQTQSFRSILTILIKSLILMLQGLLVLLLEPDVLFNVSGSERRLHCSLHFQMRDELPKRVERRCDAY